MSDQDPSTERELSEEELADWDYTKISGLGYIDAMCVPHFDATGTNDVARADDAEKVLLEENEATLGNSGVCQLNENEWLVTCGEGLLSMGKRKNEINKVLFARISVKKNE